MANSSIQPEQEQKKRGRKALPKSFLIPPVEAKEPLWLSVSEAAKLAGVGSKTVRRAIEADLVSFKVVHNRYLINFASWVSYLYKTTKLRNKFLQHGLGQYIKEWKV